MRERLLSALVCATVLSALVGTGTSRADDPPAPEDGEAQAVAGPEILLPTFFVELRDLGEPWQRERDASRFGWARQIFQIGWTRPGEAGTIGVCLLAQRMSYASPATEWIVAVREAYAEAGGFTEWLYEEAEAAGRPVVYLGLRGPATLPMFGDGQEQGAMVLCLFVNGPDILQIVATGPESDRQALRGCIEELLSVIRITDVLDAPASYGGPPLEPAEGDAPPADGAAGPRTRRGTPPGARPGPTEEQSALAAQAVLRLVRTVQAYGGQVAADARVSDPAELLELFPGDYFDGIAVPFCLSATAPRLTALVVCHVPEETAADLPPTWSFAASMLDSVSYLALVRRVDRHLRLYLVHKSDVVGALASSGDRCELDSSSRLSRERTILSWLEDRVDEQWAEFMADLRD